MSRRNWYKTPWTQCKLHFIYVYGVKCPQMSKSLQISNNQQPVVIDHPKIWIYPIQTTTETTPVEKRKKLFSIYINHYKIRVRVKTKNQIKTKFVEWLLRKKIHSFFLHIYKMKRWDFTEFTLIVDFNLNNIIFKNNDPAAMINCNCTIFFRKYLHCSTLNICKARCVFNLFI